MYGGRKEKACVAIEGADLSEASSNVRDQYREAALPDVSEGEVSRRSIPADSTVKNFSYTVADGAVYYRQNPIRVEPELNAAAMERVRGLGGRMTVLPLDMG